MRFIITIALLLSGLEIFSQTVLTMEGKTYTNSSATWLGVNIPRSNPTALTFKNNSITSTNTLGYLLQAGDEGKHSYNNNLDNAVITGNRFSWSGTDMKSITHGLFTGHNINVVAKYNYLNNVPMGIIRKSTTNMKNTSGGVAYNIVKGGAVGFVVKGMSNVNIYNNTFYTARTASETWRPLVHIYTTTASEGYSVAHGTKIYNNIFYTKYQTLSITIADNESLVGFECDYNVYWCETGTPRFSVNGSVKTFAQWQAMGYDKHSVVVNPGFKDLVNFVPSTRLNYGKDLGSEWRVGLATDAKWGTTDPKTTPQDAIWQVGAVLHAGSAAPATPAPAYVSSVVENATPAVLAITYSVILGNVVPPVSAFAVKVNDVARQVNSVTVSGTKVSLTLNGPVSAGDVVTVAYTKPTGSQLQASTGEMAETITPVPVTNKIAAIALPGSPVTNSITISPNPARENITISNSDKNQVDQVIKIFKITGELCMESSLTPGSNNLTSINLNSGIYIVHVISGAVTQSVQKLVILE
jgi:uncharacterized repeat protein (TIGR02059 family)